MNLLHTNDFTSIENIECPHELYWIVNSPAPLAGMTFPRPSFPWQNAHAAGFKHVVALHPGFYDPYPLSILFNEQLEDLIHGGPPSHAMREKELIQQAVCATTRAMQSGEGVLIHCVGGRGRTGSVIGCVLRELGFEAEMIINYLNRLHKARGKSGWPESSWQRELVASWQSIL